jgi:Tol biopolymer transport system component
LSPDLRRVAFSAYAGTARELFLWEVGTAAPRQLTHFGGAVAFLAFSRDGRWVILQFAPRGDAANELWRIAPAGGEPERILSGRGPSWVGELSTRGDLVAYTANRGGVWYLAVAGPQTPERLLDVAPETAGYLRWPTWSPDGSRIAYERAHYRSQIWILDLEPPAGDD